MSSYADLFAVRDATLKPAGTISLADKLLRLGVVRNLVMSFRTRQTTGFRAGSDCNRFHSRYRHHSLCKQPVQLQIPGRVRAETRHDSTRCYLEDPTERVAFLSCFIDQLDHLLLCFIVSTVQRRVVRNCRELIPTQLEWRLGNAAELDHVTPNLNTKHGEQLLC